MDTDDLSTETYYAVILTSEKFNHDLTLQFGVLADACKDDNDYLVNHKPSCGTTPKSDVVGQFPETLT